MRIGIGTDLDINVVTGIGIAFDIGADLDRDIDSWV